MLKRFGRFLASNLLKLSLFSLALTGAGWMTFGTPQAIKDAADESNLYQAAVDNILEKAKQNAQNQNTQVPIDRPEIEQVAREAFPAELLSRNSTSIIDGFYGWLQGKTEQPEFSVDLSSAKQSFANGVADYAVRRYDSLPPCTLAQLRGLSTEVDPFSVECRPPGLASASVRQEVLDKILSSPEFLADTNFTVADLPTDEQGRTVTDNLSRAPDAYDAMRTLPWLLAIASVVLAAGVIYLNDTKRQGLRSIGITLLGTGLFLGIGAFLTTWAFEQVNSQPKAPFDESLLQATTSLVNTYNGNLLKFYAGYIVVGAVILLSLWYQNHRNTATVKSTK
jgi:hypothetical protein